VGEDADQVRPPPARRITPAVVSAVVLGGRRDRRLACLVRWTHDSRGWWPSVATRAGAGVRVARLHLGTGLGGWGGGWQSACGILKADLSLQRLARWVLGGRRR